MHNVYMAPGCNGRIFYYTSLMLVLLSINLQNDSNECEKIDLDMCSDC